MLPLPILKKGDRIPANHYGTITRRVNDSINGGWGDQAGPGRSQLIFRPCIDEADHVEISEARREVKVLCYSQYIDASGHYQDEAKTGDPESDRTWVYLVRMPEWATYDSNVMVTKPMFLTQEGHKQSTFTTTCTLESRYITAHYSSARNRWESDWTPQFNFHAFAIETYMPLYKWGSTVIDSQQDVYVSLAVMGPGNVEVTGASLEGSLQSIDINDKDGNPMLFPARSIERRPIWKGTYGCISVDFRGGLLAHSFQSCEEVIGDLLEPLPPGSTALMEVEIQKSGFFGEATPDSIHVYNPYTHLSLSAGTKIWVRWDSPGGFADYPEREDPPIDPEDPNYWGVWIPFAADCPAGGGP